VLKIQGANPTGGMVAALVLVLCETILIIAMALFFTSFSSPFLSGLFCLGVFVAGRNADLISKLGERKGMEWMAPVLDGVSTALPNLYLFFPSGKMVEGTWATVHGQFVETGYIFSAIGYGLCYAAVFLVLSILLLNRRDLI